MSDKELHIAEVAAALDRVPHTLRVWEYQKRLPKHLLPGRDARGWRIWTEKQLEELKQWMVDEDMYPGKHFRKMAQERNARP